MFQNQEAASKIIIQPPANAVRGETKRLGLTPLATAAGGNDYLQPPWVALGCEYDQYRVPT